MNEDDRREEPTMPIEVLIFDECPNAPEFRRRVAAAAHEICGCELAVIDQESLAPSDLRRGYPSPTALVHGRDLFGMPSPASPAIGCRVYPGGLPTVADIAARLKLLCAQ